MTFWASYVNLTDTIIDQITIKCLKDGYDQEFCEKNKTWVGVHLGFMWTMMLVFIFFIIIIISSYTIKKYNFIEKQSQDV